MILQNIPTLLVYAINGSICLAIGALLLCSKTLRLLLGRKDYFGRAKHLIGLSAIIEAFVSLVIAMRIYNGVDFVSLNKFFVPLFFYFSLCLDVSAALLLLHSPRLTRRSIISSVSPVLAVWLLHIALFVPRYGLTISATANQEYLTTGAGEMTCWLLYLVLAVEGIFFICYIIGQSIRYNMRIDNYFVGEERSQSRWLLYLTLSIAIYYVLYAVDFVFFNSHADLIIMTFKTVFALLNAIAFINCRHIFWNITPAFDETLNIRRDDSSAETAIEQNEIGDTMPAQPYRVIDEDANGAAASTADETSRLTQVVEAPSSQQRSIDAIVDTWINREDKPYLRESVTIVQVADEMNLNVRLLSKYINNVKGKNFNAWINEFKVREVKRLLEEKPQMSMAELAYEVGFSDSPAMSKIFKAMVGVPPSVYKQRLMQRQIDELKGDH